MPSSRAANSVNNIEISAIIIKAPTNITLIKLSIGGFQCNHDVAQDKSKEKTLSQPLHGFSLTSESSPLIVKVRLEGMFGFNKSKRIDIKCNDFLSNAADISPNKRQYRTIVNGIEVIIESVPVTSQASTSEVPVADAGGSTTDQIFTVCPRFRVLVIGRTGAGKTSLIKNTFGVTEALISHGEVGESDIHKELFSFDENKRFVLHDSKGFEPGDVDNFETVIKFLNDRKNNPDIKDQVHAVWLCFSISIAGDRLFETGSENFLQLLSEGKLGKMPIIAIFTKYDQLVDHIDIFENPERNLERAKAKAKARLEESCVKPFKEQISGRTKIPHIAVSTAEEYKPTLHELTQLTTQLVGEYLTEDVAVLSAVAQQVSPTLKLDAVIAVGKKRYWRGLVAIIKLPGNQIETVLQYIHQDIVCIWNLQDPHELLDSGEFKRQVANIISQQDIGIVRERNPLSLTNMAPSVTMLAALAGIITALAGPAAPIVLPIATVLVVGHWTVLILKQAGVVLERLTIYIVALTIIMQNIFAIATSTNNVVSRRLIKLALAAFLESSQKEVIPTIREHMQHPGNFGRDAILKKITELLQSKSNRIPPDDMAKIKDLLRNVDVRAEDSW